MKQNSKQQDQFKLSERNGQLVIALNSEKIIPENAPVRLASAMMEELDYKKLYGAYSRLGRKSAVDPRVMFKVLVYGYMCGIYSSRKPEEACRYRIDFMWLLEDGNVPDHSTLARFRTGRCSEIIEELFYQLVKKLYEIGEVDYQTVFIDGTKLESRAGRYTFVWRGTAEEKLSKVKKELKEEYGFDTLSAVREYLAEQALGIEFVHGSGRKKSESQKQWERLAKVAARWEKHAEELKIMGENRNSYSKTDPDATFMRLKEDHMRNGQLKPAYNMQVAVNSEYITGAELFTDRNDVRTLKPMLQRMEHFHEARYEEVTADAGYESLENYLYLESTGQMCFIKPTNYDNRNSKKFKAQLGRIENMRYDAIEDCYYCAEDRKLLLQKENTRLIDGRWQTEAWYRCEDCTGCSRRAQCCRAKDQSCAKELHIKRDFWELRKQATENITSPRGIHLRQCRSIQAEGTFALLKNDFGFRRFLTKGRANVRTEMFLLALAFDLKKYWMKRENGRLQTRASKKMTA